MVEKNSQKNGPELDVLCIGQAVIDCITRGQEPDKHRENVFRAERIELHIGGDAVNESIALAQLGHRAAIACGTGRDIAGNILHTELSGRGVDISRIRVMDTLTTPVAQLAVHQDGGRHSINSRATMLEGYIPEPAELRLEEARIVSLASLFRAPLDRAQTIRDIVLAAKACGAVVSADTKLPTYRELGLEELADILPLIDYFFPNEKEASYYSGITLEEDGKTPLSDRFRKMADVFRGYGIRNVIIKAGADGCYVSGEEGAFHLPARPVKVVDSTGAGDNFVAGFLSGVLRGEGLAACAERGLGQAARCISRMGASEEQG